MPNPAKPLQIVNTRITPSIGPFQGIPTLGVPLSNQRITNNLNIGNLNLSNNNNNSNNNSNNTNGNRVISNSHLTGARTVSSASDATTLTSNSNNNNNNINNNNNNNNNNNSNTNNTKEKSNSLKKHKNKSKQDKKGSTGAKTSTSGSGTAANDANLKPIAWEKCHAFFVKCHRCSQDCKEYEAYCLHLRNHYSDKDWLVCEQCGKSSAHKSNFISHIAKHTNCRPFECIVDGKCNVKTSTRQNLVTHIKKVHKMKVIFPKGGAGAGAIGGSGSVTGHDYNKSSKRRQSKEKMSGNRQQSIGMMTNSNVSGSINLNSPQFKHPNHQVNLLHGHGALVSSTATGIQVLGSRSGAHNSNNRMFSAGAGFPHKQRLNQNHSNAVKRHKKVCGVLFVYIFIFVYLDLYSICLGFSLCVCVVIYIYMCCEYFCAV